jgi:CHAT domain-containing protein
MRNSLRTHSIARLFKIAIPLFSAFVIASLDTCSWQDSTRHSLLSKLTDARLPRAIQPRLSVDVVYHRCDLTPTPRDAVPSVVCSDTRFSADALGRAGEVAREVRRLLRRHADPEALHADALVELLTASAGNQSVNRAVEKLERAQRLNPSASLLADLSAAYLVRAGLANRPADLIAALDAAHHALSLDSTHTGARFNAALVEERIGLDHVAAEDRNIYLVFDPASPWADEARATVRPQERKPNSAPNVVNADSAELVRLAAMDAQKAREAVLDYLLPSWGAAVLAGDSVEADRVLRRAEILGAALLRRQGGDGTSADLAMAARSVAPGDAMETLARAHLRFRAARAAFAARRFSEAEPWFAEADRHAGASPALRNWARYYRLVMGHYRAGEDASVLYETMFVAADTLRHPAFAGRLLHSMTTLAGRRGSFAAGLAYARRAERLLLRSGEHENAAAVQMLASEDAYHLGDADGGARWMLRALSLLRHGGNRQWLHNQLAVAAESAGRANLPHAAARLLDEDIAALTNAGPHLRVEARLRRASARARLGRTSIAREDVAAGATLLDSLSEPRNREWSRQDLRLATVMLDPGLGPATLARIDSVVRFFDHPDGVTRLVEALGIRADTRRAAGDVAGAEADLDSLSRMLQRRSGLVRSPSLRASMLETGRSVTDRLAMLHVRAGRPREALEAVERGRSPLLARARASGGVSAAAGARVVVSLALVGDTLLAWTLDGDRIQFRMDTVSDGELRQLIELVSAGLEGGVEKDYASEALAAVQAILLPLVGPLPTDAELVLVVDGELARIPFVALRLSGGPYLLEERVVRMAASLSEALLPRSSRPPDGAKAVFVAAAFDRTRHPWLAPLPEALSEVREAAAVYPRHLLLTGAEATPSRVRAAVAGAGVVHVAGHAVFDDIQPWRSFLVLAPESGRDVIYADELGAVALQGVRLLVLSACETQRGSDGRATGMAGLTAAAMGAGADGVIGSLWRVEDRQTRLLMTALHRAYRPTGDAAAALREAQLSLLRSSDAALQSPAAWAGFRYAGR